jgi:hypothetical protein
MLLSLLLNNLTPMSQALLGQARQQAAAGQLQFAVVLAQAACELRTEDAIIELMRHRKAEFLSDALLNIFTTASLSDERLCAVYSALTGDDPKQTPWWSDWIKGRKLRHDVAHAGKVVTPQETTSCIDSAEAFIAHVTTVVGRVMAT